MTGKNYWVYILASKKNGTIYVGIRTASKRARGSTNATSDGFTKRYGVTQLYFEQFRDVENAIAREKRIKGGSRARKIALIEKENPEWRDLSEHWFD